MSRLRIPALDLELDPASNALLHRGTSVPCAPLSRRLLGHLALHSGRTVSSEELLAVVWRGVHVSPSSVRQAMRVLRRELESIGVEEPVVQTVRGRGYRLACAVEVQVAAEDPIAEGRLPLTGRDAELESLFVSLDGLRSNRGSGALLRGPAGIGKTRLAEELLRRAEQRGIPARFVRCADAVGAPPLWCWEQVLYALEASDRVLGRLSTAESGVLRSTFMKSGGEATSSGFDIEPGAARLRLFTAIENAIALASKGPGLVVVIDDLQLIDEVSLQIFRRLSTRLDDMGLLLVGTLRSPARELDDSLRHHLVEILRGEAMREIRLVPLGQTDVERIVHNAFPDASAARIGEYFQRSGGNPFMLRVDLESARAAEAREATRPEPEANDALLYLLNAMPEPTLDLLKLASLIGAEIRPSLLALVDDVTEADVAAQLAPARAAGFVIDRADEVTAFAHAIVIEALQSMLEREARAALHAKIATVLATSPGASSSAIAGHAFAGRSVYGLDGAATQCERAALAATHSLAFEEAATCYERALACTSPRAETDRLRLLLGLIEAGAHAGCAERFEDAVEEATRIATSLGDARRHARVVLAMGLARGTEDGRPSPQWIHRIESALADCTAPSPERVRLLSSLAEARWFEPPFATARSLAMESVELATSQSDPDALCEALVRAHRICQSGPGDEEIRAELSDRLAQSLGRTRNRLIAIEANVMLMAEAARNGDRPRFDHWVTRAVAEADGVGGPHARWWALVARCSHAQLVGRLDEADELADLALEVGESAGLALARANFALQKFSLWHDRDRRADAVPILREAVRWNPGNPAWLVGLRFAETASGRTGPARELLRAVIEGGREIPDHIAHPDILFYLAEIAIALEDPELAHGAYSRLLPLADQHGLVKVGFCHWGSHHGRLGQLASLWEDQDLAERHLREAILRNRRLGALAWVAHNQLSLARVLGQRGRPGDEPETTQLRRDGDTLRRDLGIGT